MPEVCPNCGAQLSAVTNGCFETSKCTSCDFEQHILIEAAIPVPTSDTSELFEIIIYWQSQYANPHEILAIKHFMEEFHDRSIAEVQAILCDKPNWSLGIHPHYIAKRIQQDALVAGLTAEIQRQV